MKNYYTLLLSTIMLGYLPAQTSADSTTFSSTLGVQEIFNPSINSQANCSDTLSVSIPAGNWVYGVDVSYTIQTVPGFFGGNSPNDIDVYLECLTQNTKENQLFSGTSTVNGAIETVQRNNLQFANGAVAGGQVDFKLHAFINTFFGTSCDTTGPKISAGSWKVVVHHGPAPTCFKPSSPQVNYVMHNRAELSWTSGGAANWQVEYGLSGFSLGSGTLVQAGSNPFVLSGLNPNTAYDFYVRDSCGVGNVSQWSAVSSFSTICNPVSFVNFYEEDFDGSGWSTGTGALNANNTIGTCWERSPTAPTSNFFGSYAWGTGNGGTPSANTGPAQDVSGSGDYLYTEASAGNNQDQAILTSPLIDLSPLTVPELEFHYHRYGGSVGALQVQVWSASLGWQTVWNQSGPQNQSSSAAAWIEENVTLNGYANDTIRLRFIGTRSFQLTGDLAIDEVEIDEAPACPNPSQLVATARTQSSVTLAWNATSANSWRVQYGAPGFSLGTGTTVNLSTNPGTVTGLSIGTVYEFYIQSLCSGNDTSDWVGPLRIPTFCNSVAAPFSENFDSSPWQGGTGAYNAGDSVAPCWWRSPGRGLSAVFPAFWGIRSTSGTTPNTGPNQDFSGSGNYAYLESSAGSTGQEALLETPLIDLSTLTTPELRFQYHLYGNSMGSLAVDVYSTATQSWTNKVFTLTGQQQSSATDPWLEAIVDLSAFVNDSVAIRFIATKGNERRSDMAIDEVQVQDAPACPQPDSLQVTNATQSSITLSWRSGGATQWQLEYGPAGFSPGTGTVVLAGSNPFTLAPLSPSQTYDFYVRDSCGMGLFSQWSGPATGQTLCGISFAPWNENFDNSSWVEGTGALNSGNLINNCWSRPPTGNPNFGTGSGGTPSGNTGPANDVSGSGNYLYTEGSGGAAGAGEISTPRIALTTGISKPSLRFNYHMYGNDVDSLRVELNNGSGFNRIWSITGAQQNASTAAWSLAQIDLSSYNADTVQIKFIGYTGGPFGDIGIDEVGVEDIVCPQPTSLGVQSATTTSVTLSWTSNGSNWLVEYGPTGFSPGSGTVVPAAAVPFTVGGLSANTSYDFYVRDSCGPGDISAIEGPATVQTLCQPLVAPYQENFDSTSWQIGAGPNNLNNLIDPCWRRPSDANPNFGSGNGPTASANTGPNADFSGSGNYIYTEYSGVAGQSGEISSPLIAIPSSFTAPRLQFYYHMYGAGIDSLVASVDNGNGTFTPVGRLTGAQQSSSTDAWRQADFDLLAFLGDTIIVKLTGYSSNFNGDIAVDHFQILDETCPPPTNLAATGSTLNSITLSWTSGGASQWQIEYGLVGFSPGQGTLVSAATNPFTLTGLNASTFYDFYLRDSCGSADVSSWVGPVSFSTLCDTVLAPYFENFDAGFDRGQDVAGAQNVNSTISPCWWRDSDTNYFWGGGTAGTPTGGTGPFGDHTSGGGNYVYVESSFAPNGATAQLETPVINLDSLQFPELRFWYQMWEQNGTQGTLVWAIDSGNGVWIPLDSLSGNQGFAWQEAFTDLRDYAGTSVIIRFTATKASRGANTQQGDIALDDLSIVEGISCPAPDSLTAIDRDLNTLDINWVSGGANEWLLRHKALGSGSYSYSPVSAVPFQLAGLNPQTSYLICVRDSCGPGDVSAWICDTVQTACSPLSMPYTENFDGAAWQAGTGFTNVNNLIDDCWVRVSDNNPHFGTGSGATPSGPTGPAQDVSGGGNYLYTEYSATTEPFGQIKSPYVVIDTSVSNPELKFSYHMYGNAVDSLTLSAQGRFGESALWRMAGQQQGSNAAAWRTAVVNLSAFSGDTLRLIFRGYGNGFTSDMAFDEVSISDATCPAPDSLQVSSMSSTSVTLNWVGNLNNAQIEYGPVGFSPGTGARLSANSSPFTVSGLSAGTFYDFYLRDSCSASDSSIWVGPLNVITNCGTAATPYFEDFDNGFSEGTGAFNTNSTVHPCWNRSRDSLYHWGGGTGLTPSAGTGPFGDHTSGNGSYVYVEATGGRPGDTASVTSPQIDLSGLTNPELRFWMHAFSQNNNPGKVVWQIRSGSGSFVTIDSTNSSQGNIWVEYTADLSSYAGQTIAIRFKAEKASGASNFEGDFAIDDLSIDEKVVCPVRGLPFTENFDGSAWAEGSGGLNNGDVIDACWNRPATPGFSWTTGTGTTPSATTGPNTDVSGNGNYLYTEASRGTGSAWISTPQIWMDSTFSDPYLWFSYFMFGTAIDTLSIQVNDGSGWSTNLLTILGQQQSRPNLPWRSDSLSLSSYRGDTIQIRFIGAASAFQGDIAIDEINLDDRPTNCPDPTNLAVSNATPTSFDISWNSSTPPGSSYLTWYEIAAGPGTMVTVPNLSSPYTLSGLQPASSYAIAILDSCGLGVTSNALFDTATTTGCDTVQVQFTFTTNLLSANFDASASQFADSLVWDFGDGNQGVGIAPGHTYASAGLYTVQLIGFDACGLSDTISRTLRVCDTLLARLSLTKTLDSISYTSNGSQGANGFFWDLGDGTTDTNAGGSHTYTLSNSYTIRLTVFNDCGDTARVDSTISICAAPQADWTFTILPPTGTGMTVQFDASASVNAATYSWAFGDGATGTGVNPVHTYATPGLFYFVSLTVTNSCGDKDLRAFRLQNISLEEYLLQQSLEVFPVPTADDITVQWSDENLQIHKLTLMDMQGRLVYDVTLDVGTARNSYRFSLKNIAEGSYLLHIQTNKGTALRRLLKN